MLALLRALARWDDLAREHVYCEACSGFEWQQLGASHIDDMSTLIYKYTRFLVREAVLLARSERGGSVGDCEWKRRVWVRSTASKQPDSWS